MRAALAHCRPHQSKFEGMEWVYSDVAMRWTKWMVRAKSGMSLEREMTRSRNITLWYGNILLANAFLSLFL